MMKKLLLFIIVAFMSTIYVNAQSLSLSSWNGEVLNDTVTVWVDPTSTDATAFHAIVNNNSENIINVKVIRTNIDVLEDTFNTFCFANACYPPNIDTSGTLVIPAGASSPEDDFKGEYTATGINGTSLIKYKFYNEMDTNDTAQVVVKFWSSPAAIDESLANSISLSNAYPNPTHTTFNIDYSFDVNVSAATVKIVNLLGSVVKEAEMNQNANKLSIDVSNLNAGIYFYAVFVNNEVFQTKKLVIR